MKVKVKCDHRSKFSNLSNWKEEAWKKSGLQRDSNPWPPRYRCDALPTELWSHTLGARSIYWVHIFPCSEMMRSLYEIIHICTAVQIWIISYKLLKISVGYKTDHSLTADNYLSGSTLKPKRTWFLEIKHLLSIWYWLCEPNSNGNPRSPGRVWKWRWCQSRIVVGKDKIKSPWTVIKICRG